MKKEEFKITLMDGRELYCILKSEQPYAIDNDTLNLDETGEYLSFGKRKPKVPSNDVQERALRQYGHHIFTENAWFLLDNAEKIFSDSRMFFAPVKVQNGLAYTGINGFRNPTIGIYLEWWLNYKEAATDKNGNLVWFISGSPLSGRNCCSVVNSEGKQLKIAQRTIFSDIWGSFMNINNRYEDAKQRCEAYTFEEVLIKLHGEDYKYRIIELRHEMVQMVMDKDKSILEKCYNNLVGKMERLVKSNRRFQLRQNHDKIMEFYKGYSERHKHICELEKAYSVKHKELKRQLHDGTIQGDYHILLADASREFKARKREQSEGLNKFIRETFGSNPNNITPSDVVRYASGRPLGFISF